MASEYHELKDIQRDDELEEPPTKEVRLTDGELLEGESEADPMVSGAAKSGGDDVAVLLTLIGRSKAARKAFEDGDVSASVAIHTDGGAPEQHQGWVVLLSAYRQVREGISRPWCLAASTELSPRSPVSRVSWVPNTQPESFSFWYTSRSIAHNRASPVCLPMPFPWVSASFSVSLRSGNGLSRSDRVSRGSSTILPRFVTFGLYFLTQGRNEGNG